MTLKTDLEDSAQAFVDIALNSSMTGQNVIIGKLGDLVSFKWQFLNLIVDAGLSN